MERGDMSSVGLTAHFTAYAWHLLGVREAHRFTTGRGLLLHVAALPLRGLSTVLGLSDPLDVLLLSRHLVLERVISDARCNTYVEIASGLSPRGTAYSRDPRVLFVEVDLPEMSRLKRQMVGEERGEGQRFVPGDATDPVLYQELLPLLHGRAPVTVVVEGLSAYLERRGLELLVRNVARLLEVCGGGRLVMDINPADAVNGGGVLGRLVVAAVQTVARFPVHLPVASPSDGVHLLQGAGFERVLLHDPRTHPACAGHDFSGTRGAVLVLEGIVGHV